jgi:enamine deaminase RidA (YjgF/YER057c/UK114 family)
MSGSVEQRLAELGHTLPTPPKAAAKYVPTVRTGNLVFVAGQISALAGGEKITGKLGDGLSIDEGRRAAQICALNILAQLKAELGDLDRITRIVRLNGFVNATPDFADHPAVINGASELIGELLGEKGAHSRIALGAASLPFGSAVEIDAVVEVA